MIRRILVGLVVNALALYITVQLLNDIQYIGGLKFFVVGGFIIGFLNVFLKPLLKILSLPLMVLTVGLFSLVINTLIFWLAMQTVNALEFMKIGVLIQSGWTYFFAAIIFGVVNWALYYIFKK